jgi:hypothetical protein
MEADFIQSVAMQKRLQSKPSPHCICVRGVEVFKANQRVGRGMCGVWIRVRKMEISSVLLHK